MKDDRGVNLFNFGPSHVRGIGNDEVRLETGRQAVPEVGDEENHVVFFSQEPFSVNPGNLSSMGINICSQDF